MGEIRPSFDANRQTLGKVLPLDTPFNVILDTSEVCNFKCDYCFRSDVNKMNWGYARDAVLMDWDIFEKAVSQIREFPDDVKQISLSNHGEPLANRALPDMVRYIKDQGIKSRVSIHTNASLLDEDYAIELADSRIDRIVISLQGLTGEKYRDICSAEIDYDVFYHNLSILYQHKNNTQIHIKIANVALDEGEEDLFYQMYSPIADRVFVEKIVPIWKGVDTKNVKNITMQNKFGENFPIQECCPLIFHTIVVTPKGDVYPCTQLLSDQKLGNIQYQTLYELWNCKSRKELLLRQCNGNCPELCRDCYILQNSIYSKEDMIDQYRDEILERLEMEK